MEGFVVELSELINTWQSWREGRKCFRATNTSRSSKSCVLAKRSRDGRLWLSSILPAARSPSDCWDNFPAGRCFQQSDHTERRSVCSGWARWCRLWSEETGHHLVQPAEWTCCCYTQTSLLLTAGSKQQMCSHRNVLQRNWTRLTSVCADLEPFRVFIFSLLLFVFVDGCSHFFSFTVWFVLHCQCGTERQQLFYDRNTIKEEQFSFLFLLRWFLLFSVSFLPFTSYTNSSFLSFLPSFLPAVVC